jgi:hypothetical protein
LFFSLSFVDGPQEWGRDAVASRSIAPRVNRVRREPESNGDFAFARIGVWLFGWKAVDA